MPTRDLQLLEGRPLAAWVVECLAAQTDEIMINANRNRDLYAAFGHRIVGDRVGGFAGPLAGMQAGWRRRGTTWSPLPRAIRLSCRLT